MFSSGTFHRYLYEIESTQKSMLDLYHQLADQTSDESVRTMTTGLIRQLDNEQQMLQRVRQLLPT